MNNARFCRTRFMVLASFCLSFTLQSVLAQALNPQVVQVPMRDGKELAADIYLPADTGSFPVILIQTPYIRLAFRSIGLPLGIDKDLAGSPYAFVIADWRCFYGSAAACKVDANRGEDGYDLVEWIATQSWCNGKIGLWGPSALGNVQFQTAREQPPSLTCMVPLVSDASFDYLEYFPGGMARTEYIEQLDGLGFNFSRLLYANPVHNLTWDIAEAATTYSDRIKVPVLMIGGWYDHNADAMVRQFGELRSVSDEAVRSQHRLLMGPWAHGGAGPAQVGTARQGELSFPNAAGWHDSLAIRFFDYYLRDMDNGWPNTPPVTFYQIGENYWDSSEIFPPEAKSSSEFYLAENGRLSPGQPAELRTFQFAYDPNDPSPTHGGATLRADLLQGPYDQSQVVESRTDNVRFTSDELLQPVYLQGKASLRLYVSSDSRDTDFVIRLTDVYPDGRSMLIGETNRRMRFRKGFTRHDTSLIVPGEVYQLQLEFPHTAYTFLPGHRIRLCISSSNYPRFNRNMNTGGEMYPNGNGDTLVAPLIATNTVWTGAERSSFIAFPSSYLIESRNELLAINWEIYPNPGTEEVVVKLDDNKYNELIIRMIDVYGRLVLQRVPTATEHTLHLDTQHLPAGCYSLQLISRGKISTKKWVRY